MQSKTPPPSPGGNRAQWKKLKQDDTVLPISAPKNTQPLFTNEYIDDFDEYEDEDPKIRKAIAEATIVEKPPLIRKNPLLWTPEECSALFDYVMDFDLWPHVDKYFEVTWYRSQRHEFRKLERELEES